jgi:hypothetical protein
MFVKPSIFNSHLARKAARGLAVDWSADPAWHAATVRRDSRTS